MKIALVTSSEGGFDFFPELKAALEKEVADIKIEAHYVSKNLDIPAEINSLTGTSLVFAWIPLDEEEHERRILTEKLIEIEMEKGLKIMKVFEPGEEDLAGEEEIELKQKKATQYKEQIMDYLFNPESFKPGYKKGH